MSQPHTIHTTRKLSELEDHALHGNVVFVRVDFNVPLNQSGTVANDAKIGMAMKTLTHLQKKGSKIVVCSHLGRPDGVPVKALSMAPVAQALGEKISGVSFVEECIGESVTAAVKKLADGEILVLEVSKFCHPT